MVQITTLVTRAVPRRAECFRCQYAAGNPRRQTRSAGRTGNNAHVPRGVLYLFLYRHLAGLLPKNRKNVGVRITSGGTPQPVLFYAGAFSGRIISADRGSCHPAGKCRSGTTEPCGNRAVLKRRRKAAFLLHGPPRVSLLRETNASSFWKYHRLASEFTVAPFH